MRAAGVATNVAAFGCLSLAGLLLAGCPGMPGAPGSGTDTDGEKCADQVRGNKVFIEIGLDNGRPKADPQNCHVRVGTRVALRRVRGEPAPFMIAFKQQSPAGPGAPRQLRSEDVNGRQRITLTANNPTVGAYAYGITIGDATVDPAIIIER